MTTIQNFASLPFIKALKSFFEDLHIPINYLSELPASPENVFGDDYNDKNPAHALINEVFVLGTVDDKAFDQTRNIDENDIKNADYDFILIVGMTLKSENLKLSTRSQLAELTRLCNKIFNTNQKGNPVTVVFRYADCISFSNAERISRNESDYREGEKLRRVSCLKDIKLTNTHAAHQRILLELTKPAAFASFEGLHEHWRKVFDTKELNKSFFKKIANWYFWAIAQSKFPYEYLRNDEKYATKTDDELQNLANQKALIRFITRIIFVWFLKEKKLVPDTLFDKDFLKKTLENFDETDNSSDYYNAILQNLFFATLNRTKDQRAFATDEGFNKNKSNFDVNSLYRYEKMFRDANPEQIMGIFEDIPFLNGGLFDSLDNKESTLLMDGFSRNPKRQAIMPDRLFFATKVEDFDQKLNEIYDTRSKRYELKGLFSIFDEYKFTVEENTPLEIDVALDPYLLGEIFENLLAYYNPETGTTARKGSGSFYTPQEIVNYMVDESLKAYLQEQLPDLTTFNDLSQLNDQQKYNFVKKLSEVKILDPACGSGAFPMGVLYKMVDLLKQIDPQNSIWKQTQHDKIIGKKIAELEADKKAIQGLSDVQVREKAITAVEDRLQELESVFNNEYNFDDYARKLFIIQNCIYGVDIQDVAIQISKLRFFLSLIIDQKNEAIKPLPNLETKFVIANTLIGLEMHQESTFTTHDPTTEKREELRKVRERYFTVTTRKAKNDLKNQDTKIRNEIAQIIEKTYVQKREEQISKLNTQIVEGEQRLNDAEKLPKEIEIIEVLTLFGEKQTSKIDKTKTKIDALKQALNALKIELNKIESHNEVSKIIDTAQKIAAWDIYDQNATADWFDMNWMFGIPDGFDVVIGNPPYKILTKNNTDSTILDRYILDFKSIRTANSKNLYIPFIEMATKILKKSGKLCYIVPEGLFDTRSYADCVEILNNEGSIGDVVSFQEMVFENAVTGSLIFLFSKDKSLVFKKKIFNSNFILTEFNEEKDSIINAFENTKTIPLNQIAILFKGMVVQDRTEMISESNINSEQDIFLLGKSISKWAINKPYYTQYDKLVIIGGTKVKSKHDKFPRILIRRTGDSLCCAYLEKKALTESTLYSCWSISENYDNRFLIGLMNSAIYTYLIRKIMITNKQAFPQILMTDLEQIPIPQISPTAQAPFIDLVERILASKRNAARNAGEDTQALEAEIDLRVYKLYELTHAEVLVIDPNLGMSTEEYELLAY